MLKLAKDLIDRPVLSLRTGGQIASTTTPLINPNNLKIEGLFCLDRFEKKGHLILLTNAIRDIIAKGILVNDHEVLTDPSELVRLGPIIDLDFELMGKPVVTTSRQHLGKVNDYAYEDTAYLIMKIYVSQTVWRNLKGGQLGIDRAQIVEITDKKIIVKDLKPPVKQGLTAPAGVIA